MNDAFKNLLNYCGYYSVSMLKKNVITIRKLIAYTCKSESPSYVLKCVLHQATVKKSLFSKPPNGCNY